MDRKMYRLGLLIAAGLFANAVVGALTLLQGTPAQAQATKPSAVYLCDKQGHPITVDAIRGNYWLRTGPP